jgi:predicted HTH transcriptional regulator
VIIRGLKDVRIANPGRFRIGIDEAISGGLSDPRNATLMKMFNLLDIGERAGSGLPNIFTVWSDEGWVTPKVYETLDPDRTVMELFLASEDDLAADSVTSGVTEGVTEVTEGVTEVTDKYAPNELAIYQLLETDNTLTFDQLADKLSISRKTVAKHIKSLKDKGKILREGNDYQGYWMIP